MSSQWPPLRVKSWIDGSAAQTSRCSNRWQYGSLRSPVCYHTSCSMLVLHITCILGHLTTWIASIAIAYTYLLSQTAFAGISHTFVCLFSSPQASMIPFRGSEAPPPNRLMAHIYGTKNFYTVAIRATTAYRIHKSPELYYLCWLTFFGVFALYSTECVFYKTVRPREAVIPLLYSSLGMAWMYLQQDYYCN